MDFGADLAHFWRPCPRVDFARCPSVLSGCELMTSGDFDMSLSTRRFSTVSTKPETAKSGATGPSVRPVMSASICADGVAFKSTAPVILGLRHGASERRSRGDVGRGPSSSELPAERQCARTRRRTRYQFHFSLYNYRLEFRLVDCHRRVSFVAINWQV